MINLLPADVKSDRKYGRLNRFLLKQFVGLSLIGFIAIGFMLYGISFIQSDEGSIDQQSTERNTRYQQIKPIEDEATELNKDISTIQDLYEREVRFSKLLVDIASSIPVGAQLTDLSLTGTRIEPLQITAQTENPELAGTLLRNLVDSGIFESANLENVRSVTDNSEGAEGEVVEEVYYEASITATLTGAAEAQRKIKAAQEAEAAAASAAAAETADGGEGQ
ncbi:MAG: PilN domain-containing protein [Patescibacteria group bacterium]